MALDTLPATPEMADLLPMQVAQVLTGALLTREMLAQQIAMGPAIAVMQDGVPIAIGGLSKIWDGRYSCWGVLSRPTAPHMVALTRMVKTMLWEYNGNRLEAYVAVGHGSGEKWVGMLGFQMEGVMHHFLGDRDFTLWARVW
jgi:hypothetical protein